MTAYDVSREVGEIANRIRARTQTNEGFSQSAARAEAVASRLHKHIANVFRYLRLLSVFILVTSAHMYI